MDINISHQVVFSYMQLKNISLRSDKTIENSCKKVLCQKGWLEILSVPITSDSKPSKCSIE